MTIAEKRNRKVAMRRDEERCAQTRKFDAGSLNGADDEGQQGKNAGAGY
jgi:hypothetical protein